MRAVFSSGTWTVTWRGVRLCGDKGQGLSSLILELLQGIVRVDVRKLPDGVGMAALELLRKG